MTRKMICCFFFFRNYFRHLCCEWIILKSSISPSPLSVPHLPSFQMRNIEHCIQMISDDHWPPDRQHWSFCQSDLPYRIRSPLISPTIFQSSFVWRFLQVQCYTRWKATQTSHPKECRWWLCPLFLKAGLDCDVSCDLFCLSCASERSVGRFLILLSCEYRGLLRRPPI